MKRVVIALPKKTEVSNITRKKIAGFRLAVLIAKLTGCLGSFPACCSNCFCTIALPVIEEHSERLRQKIVSQPSSSATIPLSLSSDLLSLLSSSIHSLDKLICF